MNWDVWLAFGLSLAWAAWTLHVYWRHRPKHTVIGADTIVAYASQSGTATSLARQKFESLPAPHQAQLVSLAELSLSQLQQTRRAVFVVSTYGDGEPPDQARRFARELELNDTSLSTLEYEVVALGDSRYPKYCRFGEHVYQSLSRLGAKAVGPLERIDAAGREPEENAIIATLLHRERLNTLADEGLFRLVFAVQGASWRAGDLVSIHPYGDTKEIPRRYSIASAERPTQLELVVRQHQNPEGGFGLCSGWLTDQIELKDKLSMALVSHKACHIEHGDAPILLIGAGSGWAGIRGHLSARRCSNAKGATWLIYGERFPDPRQPLHQDIGQWRLKRCDLAFSRSPQKSTYVQDIVRDSGAAIADFLGNNGHIYVCGRHEGMGVAVDAELQRGLGRETFETLLREQRYHRDLY